MTQNIVSINQKNNPQASNNYAQANALALYNKPQILETAKRFINVITYSLQPPSNPKPLEERPVHWQLFIDDKTLADSTPQEDKNSLIWHSKASLNSQIDKLIDAQKKGSGVYLTINDTDGRGRSLKNIVNYTCLFIDSDRSGLPDIEKFPIKPQMILQREGSSSNWHCYYIIKHNSFTPEQWKVVMIRLALYFGTDLAVCEPARVMRCPGFKHLKNFNEPKSYKIIYDAISKDGIYDIEENTFDNFIAKFPLTESGEEQIANVRDPQRLVKLAAKLDLENGDDSQSNLQLALRRINSIPPAISGTNGKMMLFRAFSSCKELAISQEAALKLVGGSEWAKVKSIPAWDLNDLEDATLMVNTLTYCYTKNYTRNEFGALSAKALFEDIKKDEEKNPEGGIVRIPYQVSNTGTVKRNISNASMAIHPNYGLKNIVNWNEHAKQLIIPEGTLIPWRYTIEPNGMIKHEYAPAGGCYWTETDTIGIRKYLNDKMGVDFGTDMLYDAILQYAQCRGINPIKRYFESLKWDGKRRIEYLFSHYGNSSDNQKYSEFLAKTFLLSIVRRVYFPGIKVDTNLIVEGGQGGGKSTAIKILGGDWAGEVTLDLNKEADTLMALSKFMLVENAEFAQNYRDTDHQKAFLTRTEDTYRPPYARGPITIPRAFVIAITMNPKDNYLKDATGGRRFFPIHTPKWNLDKLKEDVKQIHAEMYHRGIVLGESHFVVDEDFNKMAFQKQEERRDTDIWTDVIADWVEANKEFLLTNYDVFTTKDAYALIFKGDPVKMAKQDQYRINAILRMELLWPYGTFHCSFANKYKKGFSIKKAFKEEDWQLARKKKGLDPLMAQEIDWEEII